MSRSRGTSRRCSLCAIDWPDHEDYKVCPSCLDEDGTDRCRDVKPLDSEEARSMKLNFEFERYYETWDATHSPDRLLPDAAD